jgi:ParB family chromosome partitioning protein
MTDTQSASNIDVLYIDYDKIVADTDNVRSELTEIEALADSIWAVGLINPITVRKNGDDKFHVTAGYRRHAAIGLLRKQKRWVGTVPVLCRDDEDDDSRVVAMIVENLQRVDVNPVDEAFGIQRLVEQYSYTIEDVALNLAVSEQIVKDRLKLCTLTDGALELVRKRVIPIESGLALAGADDKIQEKIVKGIGTTGNDWNTRPAIIKDEIRKAKFEQLKRDVVKELKALTKLSVKTSYPYNKSTIASTSVKTAADLAKLAKWWGGIEGKGATEISVSSNYDTWTVYATGPKPERTPSPTAPVVVDPPTVEELVGQVEVPEAVTQWVLACREVALAVAQARVESGRLRQEATVEFVRGLNKADIAAAALKEVAGQAVWRIFRGLTNSIDEKTYMMALMGFTEKDITVKQEENSPILNTLTQRDVAALVMSQPKYIMRAASVHMLEGGGLSQARDSFVKTAMPEALTFPPMPEEISAYLHEADETGEFEVEEFSDVEDLLEGYLAALEVKAGAADHDD